MKKKIIAGVLVAAAVAIFLGLRGGGKSESAEKDMPFADVQKCDLVIDVLQLPLPRKLSVRQLLGG